MLQTGNIFIEFPSSAITFLQTPLLKIGVVTLEQFFIGRTDVLDECGTADTDDDAANYPLEIARQARKRWEWMRLTRRASSSKFLPETW